MSVLDALFERAGWEAEPEPISWSITCWADWHGRWFARIEFSQPVSRRGDASELVSAAMTAAKRRIRRQVNASTAGLHVPALRYSVVGMEEQTGKRLAALTIAETYN